MKNVFKGIFKVVESVYDKLIPDEETAKRIQEEYTKKCRDFMY